MAHKSWLGMVCALGLGCRASADDDAMLSATVTSSSSSEGDASGTQGPINDSDDGGSDGGTDGVSVSSDSGTTDGDATGASDGTGTGMAALPPPDGGLDYQLGGAYEPPDGVQIVSRDRNAAPAAGLYNICYVNGYQAQPDEADFWLTEHPDLVLRDENGDPVIDPDWDEMLLDTSTEEKRQGLAAIVGGWISGCAQDGFDAVEIDNLDTYSRSDGRLTEDDAVAYMQLLSASAHGVGLAIAQKNSAEILGRAAEMGTDFRVSEECSAFAECGDYVDVYGDAVIMIEYGRSDFEKGCADFPGHSIVLRDLQLTTPGDADYVFDRC